LLSCPRKPGLSDLLVGRTAPSKTIQTLGDRRPHVLAAGVNVPSPPDLIGGSTLNALLDGLRRTYDWVVVDSPPVGVVAEPLVLAPLCDGAIVVAGAEMVPWRAAMHTLERLADAGTRILGVILNRAHIHKRGYYHSHYYSHYYGRYYHHYHRQPTGKSKVARIR
jgi:Mrp family chromosome partitioning ATPase